MNAYQFFTAHILHLKSCEPSVEKLTQQNDCTVCICRLSGGTGSSKISVVKLVLGFLGLGLWFWFL